MSGTNGGLEAAFLQSVAHVREYLNHVVQEIRRVDKLKPFNRCPHFPFFMTHFTDAMPIRSIGGIWSADLWNPKYASHIYKVTVARYVGQHCMDLPLGPQDICGYFDLRWVWTVSYPR